MNLTVALNNLVNFLSSFDWNIFLVGLGIGTLVPSYILFLLQIKREEEVKKREASIAVADLLSEWVRASYFNDHSNKAQWKMQSIYWKTILRLDKRILDILIQLFSYSKKSLTTNEVIVKCRQILLNLKEPDLKPEELNKWLPKRKNSVKKNILHL